MSECAVYVDGGEGVRWWWGFPILQPALHCQTDRLKIWCCSFICLHSARGRMSTGGGINKHIFHKEKENLRRWKTTKCKLHCTRRSVRRPFFPTMVAADQLVVVHLKGREGEMEADRGIKSDSAALSPGSLCWLSSSKQIETNRICWSCLQ